MGWIFSFGIKQCNIFLRQTFYKVCFCIIKKNVKESTFFSFKEEFEISLFAVSAILHFGGFFNGMNISFNFFYLK